MRFLLKKLFIAIGVIGFVVVYYNVSNASWRDYQNVRFEDLLFHEGNGDEVIINDQGSSGSGHFRKMMRIFVDKGDLVNVFEIPVWEEHDHSWFYPDEHVVFKADVSFLEMDDKGCRDILVKMTKITYKPVSAKSSKEKIVGKEIMGTMVFSWDGQNYLPKEVPPLIEQKYAYDSMKISSLELKGEKVGENIFAKQ